MRLEYWILLVFGVGSMLFFYFILKANGVKIIIPYTEEWRENMYGRDRKR